MKTALLYDAAVSLSGDRLRIDRAYGVEVDALAEYFQQIVLCNPVATFDIPQARYEPRAANISLEALPYFDRVISSLPVLPRCAHKIWQASRSWDLLYIRLPSPLGIIGYLSALVRKIPVVLYVVGDLEAQYEHSRYRGLSNTAARGAVKLFEYLTHWMVDHALTITQGEALCRKYKRNGNRILNISWSPIPEKMIAYRPDTCQGPCIRLLFVGTLVEKKGVFALLGAAKLLRKHMESFMVTYVGAGPCADELAQRAQDSGLSGHVELKGGIYDEVDLIREYDAADLFVFPTYAEGFPRVIFEAMARGLPVISTPVGGIPDIVKDGRDALLVNPGSPNDVAEAILKAMNNSALRQNLIRRGYEIAREYSLETTTKKHVEAGLSAFSPAWR